MRIIQLGDTSHNIYYKNRQHIIHIKNGRYSRYSSNVIIKVRLIMTAYTNEQEIL